MTAPSTFYGPRPLTTVVAWLRKGFVLVDDEGEPESGPVYVRTIGAIWPAMRPYEAEAKGAPVSVSTPPRGRKHGDIQSAILDWLATHGETDATTIVCALGLPNVRVRLCTMADAGLIRKVSRGRYAPAGAPCLVVGVGG